MVVLIIAMLLTLALAVVVVGLVAVSARREGRHLLTPHGEEVVTRARERHLQTRERTGHAVSVARQRTTTAVTSARGRAADGRTTSGVPVGAPEPPAPSEPRDGQTPPTPRAG